MIHGQLMARKRNAIQEAEIIQQFIYLTVLLRLGFAVLWYSSGNIKVVLGSQDPI